MVPLVSTTCGVTAGAQAEGILSRESRSAPTSKESNGTHAHAWCVLSRQRKDCLSGRGVTRRRSARECAVFARARGVQVRFLTALRLHSPVRVNHQSPSVKVAARDPGDRL